MRILVITNFYPPEHLGGYEQECAGVVEHLRGEHEVLVLTSRRGRHRTPREDHVRRVLPYGRFRKVDTLRAPLWAVKGARVMRSLLRSFEPDIVFVWNATQIPQSALRVAELSERPLAFRVCEHWFGRLYHWDTFLRELYPGQRGPRAAWAWAMRLVNRHPSLRLDVTTQAPASVSWVSNALRDMSQVPATTRRLAESTIYYGIEQPPPQQRALATQPTFAFVGRLTPAKGTDIACRALRELEDEQGIAARLVLIGPEDRDYGHHLRRLVKDLGLTARVDFRGPLSHQAVRRELASAHAIVVPSRWQEPAALVTMEGASLNVPVVAARSGGLPELLEDGRQALFFDIDDVRGCARSLAEVLKDPVATAARVQSARGRAAEFTFDRYYAATDRFLAETVRLYADSAAETASAMASTE